MSVDILMLELPRSDRDLNTSVPIYLELKKRGYKVVLQNLEFSHYNLVKYRPKLVFFSSLNDIVVIHQKKLLSELNIPVISLTAEGNFQENAFHGYFWGWNKDYKFYQDRLLLWNERSRDLILKYHPEYASQLAVTGSVGHDRYRNLKFLNKQEFLRQNGLNFKKVVGIAGFGLFKYIDKMEYVETVNPSYPLEQFKLFDKDRDILRRDYKTLLRNNPDTLFIVRVHPELATILEKSEFSELLNEPNAYLSSIHGNLKSVDDVINISDLWIGYESNTSIEAWLLNKRVVYYNPTTADFQRENHSKGVLILNTLPDLQKSIDEFYSTGSIAAYEELAPLRQQIIRDVIGFDDGKNYWRTANFVEEYFKSLSRPAGLSSYFKLFSRKRRRIIQEYLWQSHWYWKMRPNLNRPNLMFYPGKKFAEDYLKKFGQLENR